MKKNLIALALLLVLVAVVAQFTRHAGKKPEWVALETDMQACLQVFWQQPGQKAQLVPAEGGPMALVTVHMPAQAKASWNFPLLDFVAARHPAVQWKGMDIRDGLSGNPIAAQEGSGDSQRRAELLRRQGQAVVDEQLGRGQGLVLVDVHEVASPVSTLERPRRPGPAQPLEAAPEAQGRPAPAVRQAEGMSADQAAPAPAPQFQVQVCVVLATQPPPDQLAQIVRSLNLVEERGDAVRIVNLPAR